MQLHQVSTSSAEAVAEFQNSLIYLGAVSVDAVRQKDQELFISIDCKEGFGKVEERAHVKSCGQVGPEKGLHPIIISTSEKCNGTDGPAEFDSTSGGHVLGLRSTGGSLVEAKGDKRGRCIGTLSEIGGPWIEPGSSQGHKPGARARGAWLEPGCVEMPSRVQGC